MRYSLFYTFSLIFLTTCGPQVKFVQPQPKDGKNLSQLPHEYYGKYFSKKDSSFLEIDSSRVIAKWVSVKMMHKDSIASIEKDLEVTIKRDTQIFVTEKRGKWLSNGINLDVKFLGDSVKVNVKAENLVFEISDSQLVRKYRGHCFLNTKTKDGLWLIKVLALKGENLHFDDLLDDEQVKNIKRITHVAAPIDTLKSEPTEFYLNPTRKELRRVLRTRNSDINYTRFD